MGYLYIFIAKKIISWTVGDRFWGTTKQVTVTENLAVGTTVVRVAAHDRDVGDNAAVTYFLGAGSQVLHGLGLLGLHGLGAGSRALYGLGLGLHSLIALSQVLHGLGLRGLGAGSQALYGDVFSVDAVSGDLIVTGEVDRERAAVYHVMVGARDAGAEPLVDETTVIVKVRSFAHQIHFTVTYTHIS